MKRLSRFFRGSFFIIFAKKLAIFPNQWYNNFNCFSTTEKASTGKEVKGMTTDRTDRRSERMISLLITLSIAAAFVSAAMIGVLYYASYASRSARQTFAEEMPVSGAAVVRGNRLTLDMAMTDVVQGISDSELTELNLYGFPQGDSPYFIYVEKGAHTLSVFGKDSYGLYTNRIATWYTGTGKSDMLTPVGIFAVGEKEEWHQWPSGAYSPYATTYSKVRNHYGGLFIHGPIYYSQNFYSVSGGSVLYIGTNCSSGCLRTETEAAYFVYQMCPEGTQVKIVDGSPLGFVPYRNVYVSNQQTAPSIEKFQLVSVTPDAIAFAEDSHSMTVGEVYCPEILTTPSYARCLEGTWTSNHPDIIRVSGNVIRAVGTGSAMVTLTADHGRLSASMRIQVKAGKVDTAAPPPDVTGENADLSSEDILENYQPIAFDLLRLKVNGTVYSLDEPVQPLLRELGSRDYHLETYQSCAYVGEDKAYSYTFLSGGKVGKCTISTVPMVAGEDNICEISVRGVINASLETTRGIRLGDSRADVEAAYGRYYTEVLVVNGDSDSYIKMTYWAGTPNKSGQPSLYFYLEPDSGEVIGMGIYSGRNFL